MTTSIATKTKQTWRDWLPEGQPEPPQLITRAELVEQLQLEGVNVPERTLTFWESAGVLPRPVRRWRDGSPKALYPLHWQELVQMVRSWQDDGHALQEISEYVRHHATHFLAHKKWAGATYIEAMHALDDLARAAEMDGTGPISGIEVRFTDTEGKTITKYAINRTPGPGPLKERAG